MKITRKFRVAKHIVGRHLSSDGSYQGPFTQVILKPVDLADDVDPAEPGAMSNGLAAIGYMKDGLPINIVGMAPPSFGIDAAVMVTVEVEDAI